MKKIAIHSVPRSGSSWLGEIINSSENVNYSFQPLFSYAFKAALDESSSLKQINDFYRNISLSDDDFVTQKSDRETNKKPDFEKQKITHVAYKEVRYHYVIENLIRQDPQQKVIGLVRNPLSVLSSWLNAPREFRADLNWDFNSEWRYALLKNKGRKEECFGYEKWKETTLLFKRLAEKYPNNFLLINYSNLLKNSREEVCKIYSFLNLAFTNQAENFLNVSGSVEINGTYSVFKKKSNVDDLWIKIVPERISKQIIDDCSSSGLSEFTK